MRLSELLKGVDILSAGDLSDTEITGVYNDSRLVKPGGIFVAVPGLKDDGSKYIRAAFDAGAAAVVSENGTADKRPILVPDARRALSKIAANFYGHPSRRLTLVGITGTNGKTTVSYLLKEMLETIFKRPVGLIGTNGIAIGEKVRESDRTTPESHEIQGIFSEMVSAGINCAVMEVSSHALKLNRVADVEFDVGVFTNLSQDHLDFHPSMEEYLDAKRMLFSKCPVGVVNRDDASFDRLADKAACELFTFSARDMSADLVAKNTRYFADRVEFELLHAGGIVRAALNIPGKFSVYNALAAIGVCLKLGLPIDRIIEALAGCHGVKGRAEVVRTGKDYSVIIDYAHTPDALENIITALKEFVDGRLILVFGCGGDRDAAKRPLMGKIAGELADYTIVTSDNPRSEQPMKIIGDILAGFGKNDRYEVVADRPEAIGRAMELAQRGDLILLAGKGHETYQEICGVKRHMDEREIVRSFL